MHAAGSAGEQIMLGDHFAAEPAIHHFEMIAGNAIPEGVRLVLREDVRVVPSAIMVSPPDDKQRKVVEDLKRRLFSHAEFRFDDHKCSSRTNPA
jgi:hypothetical protein